MVDQSILRTKIVQEDVPSVVSYESRRVDEVDVHSQLVCCINAVARVRSFPLEDNSGDDVVVANDNVPSPPEDLVPARRGWARRGLELSLKNVGDL